MKSQSFAILFLVISLFSPNQIIAQDVDSKLAEALQNTVDSMREVLQVNGLSAAVQLPTNALWAGASGVSSLSPIDSLTVDHIFESGSTTKTITSMCILQLVDEGKLSLDDSLHQWLPEYNHVDSDITIRQLLRHESGIADVLQNQNFQPTLLQNTSEIWTADEAIQQFIQTPSFAPGTSWAYSNTNFLLLGMIIETVTGNTFEEEIYNRFFQPLNLPSFINPAFESITEPYAHLWLDITGDGVIDDAGNFITNWLSLFSIIGPAGGYFATPGDLVQWIKHSMSGSLVSADSWNAATSMVSTTFPMGIEYGLGLMESEHLGFQALGHGGDLSYSTQALYFPEKDIGIVVMCNDARINSWNLISTVRALLQVYLDCEDLINNANNVLIPALNINVYPNPFVDHVNIQLENPEALKEVSIIISDMKGQIITSSRQALRSGLNTIQIDLKNALKNGIYLLQLKKDNEPLVSQFIIN